MAENGDIKIEVTRPEELGKIVQLIAAAKGDEPVPPKLQKLVGLVGTDVGPDELAALAETDTKFAELLDAVSRESVEVNGNNTTVVNKPWFSWIKNDRSRKKKITFVFLFVVISVGTGSVFTFAPDRSTAQQVGQELPTTAPPASSGAPTGSGSLPPPVLPPPLAPPINPPAGRPAPPNGNPAPPQGPVNPMPTRPQDAAPQLATTISQARGLPGVYVNFYGTGYQGCPGNRTVNILWDGVITESAVPIEADGRFGARVAVPENASVGEHHFYGQCTSDTGLWARTTYTVSPPLVVTANPSKLRAGQVLTVRGTNFDGCPDYGDRSVNVSIDALGLTTRAPIRADGTVEAQLTIPQGTASNDYYVTGQCRDGGNWVRGVFTVQP